MVAAAARGSIVNMFAGPHPGIREGAVRTLIPSHRGQNKQQKNNTPTCQSRDSPFLSQ